MITQAVENSINFPEGQIISKEKIAFNRVAAAHYQKDITEDQKLLIRIVQTDM